MSRARTPDVINRGVEVFFPGGEHTWDNFLHYLKQHPVLMPNYGGQAELVEEHDTGFDGESWFVFKVSGWGDPKHFKRTTNASSFGGMEHGDTYEVQPAVVQQTTWETV